MVDKALPLQVEHLHTTRPTMSGIGDGSLFAVSMINGIATQLDYYAHADKRSGYGYQLSFIVSACFRGTKHASFTIIGIP